MPHAGALAEWKKVRDVSSIVSMGGEWSPEKRLYDVSRGQNRYVTLHLG